MGTDYKIILFIILAFVGCKEIKENFVHPKGEEVAIEWNLITNDYLNSGLFKSELTILNNSDIELDNKNWELFFNHTFCRKIITDSVPSSIKIIHVNGDLYKIVPTKKFKRLPSGNVFKFTYLSTHVAIKYSDAPGGFYFVFKNSYDSTFHIEPVANVFIHPLDYSTNLKSLNNYQYPYFSALEEYSKNKKLSLLSPNELPPFIPTPLYWKYGNDSLKFNSSYTILYQKGLATEAEFLKNELAHKYNISLSSNESNRYGEKVIYIQNTPLKFSNHQEAYSLSISNNKILISGNTNDGVFYGIQSLIALLPIDDPINNSEFLLPKIEVRDSPQFSYRGVMLDVARNFQKQERIEKLIDRLSFYKINKLVIHMADDEGWRLEIPELPELTEVGSNRGHTQSLENRLLPSYGCGAFGLESSANGYYSQRDFIKLLNYANERHVDIIPEIDIPGHARAAIKAMDYRFHKKIVSGDSVGAYKYLLSDVNDRSVYFSVQQYNDNVICPCQDGVYNFLTTVVGSIKSMYEKAGVSLTTIHIGGDEVPEGVWEKSPACEKMKIGDVGLKSINDIKKYFLSRCTNILESNNLATSAYEDVVIHRFKDGITKKDSLELREEYLKNRMRLYSWNNVWGWGSEDFAYRLANKGFPVVLGHVTNLYFDLAYTIDPEETGQYWGGLCDARKVFEYTPYNIYNCAYENWEGKEIDNHWNEKVRLTEDGKKNILGIQGLLFSETLKRPEMLEYFMYPKVLALAERAWVKTPVWSEEKDLSKRILLLNKDWNIFANVIGQKELHRMDVFDPEINYRIPPPGAMIEKHNVYANVSFPGLTIKYTLDGTEPNQGSPTYTHPFIIKNNGVVRMAVFNSAGRKGTTVLIGK